MMPNEYPTRLDICDGKYTLIIDMDTGRAECLRHGEKWRDLVGDKMVLALFDELVKARDRVEAAKAEAEDLRAKIAEMERQEPVAWYSKQYGFVYMSRQPSQFEHGSILYLRNGAPAWRIEGSSKVALLDIASLPHGTVFYALPGAKGEDK